MIKQERIYLNGKFFTKTYSDTYKIQKVNTNEIYGEAYDLVENENEYVETTYLLEENDYVI